MKNKIIIWALLCLLPLMASAQHKYYGITSYYGKSAHGRRTSSGAKHNAYGYQCAHRTYPFGTKLKVKNPKNGKSVVVEVTDRGPRNKKWELDISWAAARDLGMLSAGVMRVEITVLSKGKKGKKNQISQAETNAKTTSDSLGIVLDSLTTTKNKAVKDSIKNYVNKDVTTKVA